MHLIHSNKAPFYFADIVTPPSVSSRVDGFGPPAAPVTSSHVTQTWSVYCFSYAAPAAWNTTAITATTH